MPEEFNLSYEAICKLVEKYRKGEQHYLSTSYQEAETRQDFINEFFSALGWDVMHKNQTNPYEQEVKVERGVSVGKAQKRADYAFFISPDFRTPKFFVEAKKPSRNLRNADDYFQTIRYGWNANTPIAVLTDFEEFHILDCRFKPDINNVLQNPNHKVYHFTHYENKEKFSEIYYLFSRDSVAKGSLERYVEALPKPKGKASAKGFLKGGMKQIDDDFLEYIDELREKLAKAFKKNDASLSSEELTEATQRTIDRLVFMRFLEDKLIEPEYIISEFGKKGNAWNDFITACKNFDAKYNGIVFKKHFIDSDESKGPSQSEFAQICSDISHLNSPYDFNAIPVHILGSIYERFLGKVVNATAQRVKVEEKPEVRKAGGVYYTPKYIVDYIVENTIGEIIKDKSPEEISKLHFADIACGSGSFLIGVFDTLLKYHTDYYNSHPEKAKKDGCIYKDGIWILSIKQKQKILLNNIYGVDIDNQAVEVTQLSLALKMLEDETMATANDMQALFHEKILPDLSKNIICGNSLIGTDILKEKIFSTEEERKLNPMDFKTVFPEIMKSGGFDAIVGNPPWVDIKGLPNEQVKYYFKNYVSTENRINLYAIFIEKCLSILRRNGLLGYIIPNSILYQSSYTRLRKLILTKYSIKEIVRLPDNVFDNVKAETLILFTENNSSKKSLSCLLFDRNEKIKKITNNKTNNEKNISSEIWINNNYYIFDIYSNTEIINLIKKIEFNKIDLIKICDFSLGITPYDKYKGHSQKQITNKVFHSKTKVNDTYKMLLAGGDVLRYFVEWGGSEYIKYGNWLGAPREKRFFIEERILIRQIVSGSPLRIYAAYTDKELYNVQSIFNILIKDNRKENIKFLLGILNSKLMNFYHSHKYLDLSKNLFQKILIQNCKKFPFPQINFQNVNEKQSHDLIVSLVDQMLEAKKQLHNSKTEKDRIYYERKCETLDRQIDAEVYKLYGLTEDEIKIVENKI